jgi:hypothetical protein
MGAPHASLEVRLWRHVEKTETCWLWRGCISNKGYGRIRVFIDGKPKMIESHRIAWQVTHGPIPPGLHVLHKCDNPPCCNPDHLFLGTHGDNMRDMESKGRSNKTRGSKHHNAKLSEDDVREIRRLYSAGFNRRRIAEKFRVTLAAVKLIAARKSWKHVV